MADTWEPLDKSIWVDIVYISSQHTDHQSFWIVSRNNYVHIHT